MNDTETPAPATPAGGRRALIMIAIVGVIALVVWGTAGRDEDESRAGAEGKSVIEEFPIADRAPGKPFQAQLLSGERLNSTTLKGKVVVYNVWGSWCGPCVTEAPALVKVANAFAGQVTFVGINVRDNDGAAKAFEREYKVPYDSITSADSIQAMGAFHNSLAASAVPTTLVVDREGRVAARAIGPVTATTLSNLIEPVLAEDDVSR